MEDKKKILLVSVHIEDSPRAVPLGAAMLASNIEKKVPFVEVKLLDLYLSESIESCYEKIADEKPDITGFSTFIWNRKKVLALAEKLKNETSTLIAVGGAEATADSSNLRKETFLDYIIEGEGEEKIVELLKSNDMSAGSEYSDAPLDLAELPSPYLNRIINLKNYKGTLWELSRGCPFSCDFCYESKGKKEVRTFPIERIRDELKLFKDGGVNEIFVLDPTFNHNKRRAKEILRLLVDEAPQIHYTIEIRAEFLDEEMAELFSMINCSLQIGLQSADERVLKNINRNFDAEIFEEKIFLLHEYGVLYGFDLIYGLPGDTLENFKRSLDYALSIRPNHLDIFPLSVLPGTRLKDNTDKFDLVYEEKPPYRMIETSTFKAEDFLRAESMADAADFLYNRGKAVPWFMILCEELGLTPSEAVQKFAQYKEISENDVDDVFKTIEEFIMNVFKESGQEEKGILAADIAKYFGYTSTLMEEKREVSCSKRYCLNPDLYLVEFSFSPFKFNSLISEGIVYFSGLMEILEKEKVYMVLYVDDNEVKEREVGCDEFYLLKNFEGTEDKNNPAVKAFIDDNIVQLRDHKT